MKKITKILSALVLVFACFAGVLSFSGCDLFGSSANVESITLSKNIKTTYVLGDEIDFNGAKLLVRYDDDSEKEVALSISMVTGFDTDSVTASGQTRTLTITYKGKKISKNYTVSQPDVQELLRTAYQNLISVEDVETDQLSKGPDSDLVSNTLIKKGDTFKYRYFNSDSESYQYETVWICASPTFKCTSENIKQSLQSSTSLTSQGVLERYAGAYELKFYSNYSAQLEVKIENGKYKITGTINLSDGISSYDASIEIIISFDKKIEYFKVDTSDNVYTSYQTYSYFYTNVPQISYPEE